MYTLETIHIERAAKNQGFLTPSLSPCMYDFYLLFLLTNLSKCVHMNLATPREAMELMGLPCKK